MLTAEQKILSAATYKTFKEHKKNSPSPSIVDPNSVQILRQVESEKPKETVTTSKKTATSVKSTPSEEPSRKKSSKSSSDDLKLWITSGQRFTRLEAMLLAKSFSVLVEPVKQTFTVVTSERPIFLLVSLLPVPALYMVLYWSPRSPAVSLSPLPVPVLQPTGLANHPASFAQPVGVPGQMSLAQPTGQITADQDVTGANVMPDVQFTGPVGQTVSKVLP